MVRLRFTLPLVTALLGACAGDPADTTLDITFDVCQPIAVVAGDGASVGESDSIDAALGMWLALGAYPLGRDGAADQVVEVRFQDAAPQFHGLYDDEAGVVYVNRALVDPHQRAVTVAHELGHAFGLEHVASDQRDSVMNPANLVIEPDAADAADLERLWGSCR